MDICGYVFYPERSLSLVVGEVEEAAGLGQALHHPPVAMPTATQQRRVPILQVSGGGKEGGRGREMVYHVCVKELVGGMYY